MTTSVSVADKFLYAKNFPAPLIGEVTRGILAAYGGRWSLQEKCPRVYRLSPIEARLHAC